MEKLGFGLMRLPTVLNNEKKAIDIEELKNMVDTFLENGFTYFDTAWMYCEFESEKAIKTALVDRHPRESFKLATKLHAAFLKTKEDRDIIFNKQLEKTGAGYFDYYLIHDIEKEFYTIFEDLDCFNWLMNKKKAGLVKNIGFSFHDSPEFLDKVLTEHPEMEFVQLQINYLDWESNSIQSRKCYEVARKHNKPIIVMEPVKGGTLANMPKEAVELFKKYHSDWSVPSWAIRFSAGLDGVFMVLSGMSNMAQLTDNISYMKGIKPLSQEEKEVAFKAVDIIKNSITVPCTGCSYCTDGCPANIPIPKYFEIYNEAKRYNGSQKENYKTASDNKGKAGECIGCGQCESVCPQHIEIIEHLKGVAKLFEA